MLEPITLCFNVYFKDDLAGRIEIVCGQLVKNECYLTYPKPQIYAYYPFINSRSVIDVYNLLEERIVPRGRSEIDDILKELGLNEYNVYDIIRKNHGVSYDDFTWFKFDDIKEDELLTYSSVRLR